MLTGRRNFWIKAQWGQDNWKVSFQTLLTHLYTIYIPLIHHYFQHITMWLCKYLPYFFHRPWSSSALLTGKMLYNTFQKDTRLFAVIWYTTARIILLSKLLVSSGVPSKIRVSWDKRNKQKDTSGGDRSRRTWRAKLYVLSPGGRRSDVRRDADAIVPVSQTHLVWGLLLSKYLCLVCCPRLHF